MKNPFIELVLLAAIWGASFLFMRVGSPEFGTFAFMALRTLIASLFLLPLLIRKKQLADLSGNWQLMLIASFFNTALPFALFGYAAQHLFAGTTAVLNATTPIFTAIVGYFWLRATLTKLQILGLFVGLYGVYLLMADKFAINFTATLLPTLAVLAATCCYGIGANMTKKKLSHIKPLAMATGSQVCATVLLLPLAIYFWPEKLPSTAAIGSVILLGIICTGIAYILFFRLITHVGPSYAVSVTYLIPLFGLFWGNIFLNEKLTANVIIGCSTILLGVALTTGILTNIYRKFSVKKPI